MSDKGKSLLLDILVCLVLIFISFFIFSRMPDDLGIIGWIMFAVGCLLFTIGLFRILAFIDDPVTMADMRFKVLVFAITAAIIQFMGYAVLYHEEGSMKGIAIATYTLIVGLAMMLMISDTAGAIPDNLRKTLGWGISALLLGIAVGLNIRDGFSDGSVAVGTLLIIEIIANAPLFLG